MAEVFRNFLAGRQLAGQEQQQRNLLAQQGVENQRQDQLLGIQQGEYGLRQQQSQRQQEQFEAERQRSEQERVTLSAGRSSDFASKALAIADPVQRRGFVNRYAPALQSDFAALWDEDSEFNLQAMLAKDDPSLAADLQQLAALGAGGEDSYTLKPGEARFVGNRQVASLPGSGEENGFTLSPGQIRYGPDGKPIANAPMRETPSDVNNVAAGLRKEYNDASKEFLGVANSYQRILDSASNPSAAGDLSLIFNYMKVLDPGSSVREGEFATAQNAGSVPGRVVSLYNNIMRGERLNETQRADFVGRAGGLYKGQEKRHRTTVRDRYGSLAQRAGVDPALVVQDFDVTAPATTQQPAATSSGATVSNW